MTTPFQPIGQRARWRTIYDLLTRAGSNGTLTYKEIADELELHPDADRHTIQVAMRRAAIEFETADKHAVQAIPNVGYQIVPPEQHLQLAKNHQKRSTRSLVRGRSKVENVDLSGVEPEIRKAFQVVAAAFAMQMEFNRRTDIRQKQLERSLEAIREQSSRTDDEVSELRARLEQLERGQTNT